MGFDRFDMRTTMTLGILILSILLLLANAPLGPRTAQLVANSQAEGATLGIRPHESEVKVGEVFTVEVFIENVRDLGAFEFKVSFPPEIVQVQDVSIGEFLGSTGRIVNVLGPSLDNEAGSVYFGAFTFGEESGPTGMGVLATITFRAVNQGRGKLALGNVQLTDTEANVLPVSSMDGGVKVGAEKPTQMPTLSPLESPAPTATSTFFPTETSIPTATFTPTFTPTKAPSLTATPTIKPLETPGPEAIPTISPTPEVRVVGKGGNGRWLMYGIALLITIVGLGLGSLLYRGRG